MMDKYDYNIINLDALTYAGNLENLKLIEGNPRYNFIKGDINDNELISFIFNKFKIEWVVNFAAESHVDRSITDPKIFFNTNIIGTQTLLNTAKEYWCIKPDDKYCNEYKEGVKYLQVSTDEVYGALGKDGFFVENTALQPNSPYSASKASADMIVRAYYKTYGLPVNITRCSNNYGPFQFPEKLIPLMINNCLKGKKLPVYGDGLQIRDWLHVRDHCAAIDTVLHKGINGEIYNVGGNNEKSNLYIVKLIIETLGEKDSIISYVKDRPGHDRRYAIDNTKITTQLGWKPVYTFEEGIKETIEWYMSHQDWMERVTSGEYMNYYSRMYDEAI
jgi:dTDP-glucose 4,6-dehydratase